MTPIAPRLLEPRLAAGGRAALVLAAMIAFATAAFGGEKPAAGADTKNAAEAKKAQEEAVRIAVALSEAVGASAD